MTPLAPGTLLKEGLSVGRLLEGTSERRLYELAEAGFVLQEFPFPDAMGPLEREVVQRELARQARACSWLDHPRLESPRDLFATDSAVYVVLKPVEGVPLAEAVRQGPPALPEILQWAVDLCVLLDAARPPQAASLRLGSVSESNLLVDGSRRLCLVGFHLDDYRLSVQDPAARRLWKPPEGSPCDVWTVGVLLRRLLGPSLLQEADRHVAAQVSRVTVRSTAMDPKDRFPSLASLRSHLDEILWQVRPQPVPTPTPLVTPELKVTHPFRRRLVAAAVGLCVLGGVTWGGSRAAHELTDSLPALGAVGADAVAALPGGTEVWVTGTAQATGPGTLLSSPLSNTPCLAYEARLARQVRREVFDARTGEYRMQQTEQVLLDQVRGSDFLLASGDRRVPVRGQDLAVEGPRWRVPDLHSRALRAAALRSTTAGDQQVLGRAVQVQVGEQVLDMAGHERCVVPSQPVLLRARVERTAEGPVLRPVADGGTNLFLGGRPDLAVATLVAMLPGALAALLSLALGLGLWETLRHARGVSRRRALRRLLQTGDVVVPEAIAKPPETALAGADLAPASTASARTRAALTTLLRGARAGT